MPDITGISLKTLTGVGDSSSVQNMSQGSKSNQAGKRGNGTDFASVIDQTSMSVLASAQMNMTPAQPNPVDFADQKTERTPIEASPKAYASKNDYNKQSQMAEANVKSGADTKAQAGTGDEISEDVEVAAEKVMQEIATAMNVSPEEIQGAMEELGLESADLLTQEGLQGLIVSLNGEDGTALLTDDVLYGNLKAITETAEGLADGIKSEHGLSNEEFMDVLAKTISDTAEETDTVVEEDVTMQDTDVDVQASIREQATTGAQVKDTAETAGDNTRGQSRGESQSDNADASQVMSGANQFTNVQNNQNMSAVTFAAQTPQAQATEIMRQVVDFIRSSFSADMTEVEMQLNPQSLGRLNVSLQAQANGDMVAKFAAQNEQVKAALENQLPQLLQRFEEQGIKVNEVQVTIGGQAFNDNAREQMNRDDANEAHEQEMNRIGRMRRVVMNLNEMSEEEVEALGDDERIEAEMMAAEGNTVNYKA